MDSLIKTFNTTAIVIGFLAILSSIQSGFGIEYALLIAVIALWVEALSLLVGGYVRYKMGVGATLSDEEFDSLFEPCEPSPAMKHGIELHKQILRERSGQTAPDHAV